MLAGYLALNVTLTLLLAGLHAGTGTRFGAETPKQYLILAGKPVIRGTAIIIHCNCT